MPATEHKKKLDLKANVPVDVHFVYSSPILGENQYGPYEMWTVAVDGERQTLFTRNGLSEAIAAAAPMAGETLRITKTEREKGKGFDFKVERPEPAGKQPQASTPGNNGNGEADRIAAYVGRYVRICKELTRQWPDLHEKDPELFKSAAGCIYIQMSNGKGNGH
jgi:hypothetical protein